MPKDDPKGWEDWKERMEAEAAAGLRKDPNFAKRKEMMAVNTDNLSAF